MTIALTKKERHEASFDRRLSREREMTDKLRALSRLPADTIAYLPTNVKKNLLTAFEEEATLAAKRTIKQSDLRLVHELVELLNEETPRPEALHQWLDSNPIEDLARFLMCVESETFLAAWSQFNKTKGKPRTEKFLQKRKEVAQRWLEYTLGLVDGKEYTSKKEVAFLLSRDFLGGAVKPKQIQEKYLNRVEDDAAVFPDGIEAAKRELLKRHGKF